MASGKQKTEAARRTGCQISVVGGAARPGPARRQQPFLSNLLPRPQEARAFQGNPLPTPPITSPEA